MSSDITPLYNICNDIYKLTKLTSNVSDENISRVARLQMASAVGLMLNKNKPHSTGRRFRYAHCDLGFSLKLFQIATKA